MLLCEMLLQHVAIAGGAAEMNIAYCGPVEKANAYKEALWLIMKALVFPYYTNHPQSTIIVFRRPFRKHSLFTFGWTPTTFI